MTKPFGAMTVAQLSVLIQSGAADPVEVVRSIFESIEGHPDKAVFTVLLKERAIDEAKASSLRIRRGCSLGAL